MTLWIWAGNDINFSIAAGLIRLYNIHVLGAGAEMPDPNSSARVGSNEPGSVMWLAPMQLKIPCSHSEKSH